MFKKINGSGFLRSILVTTSLIALGACSPSGPIGTPTPGVDAIITAAIQTFSAQSATQLALTPPTPTASPTALPTLPPPSPPPTFAFASPTARPVGVSGCDNAAYVSDVTIPDNTVLPGAQSFVKSWLLQNMGTCTWTTSYRIAFVSGDLMGGATSYITVPVPSGNQAKVSVSLVAPTAIGTYTGRWQMQNDKGLGFGNVVTVVIKVGTGSTATSGPSPTTGPSPTAGPTSSSGTVTISGNAGAADTTIKYTGGRVTADGSGAYSFTVSTGWSGTVTPTKGKYVFSPTSRTYTNVTSDLSGENYSASLPTATSTP